MKIILSQTYHRETDSARSAARGLIAKVLFSLLLLILGSCGGQDSGDPAPTGPPSITDTSGDYAITVRADPSSQIYVSWTGITYLFCECDQTTTIIYRDGAEIATAPHDFPLYNLYYTDTGLLPNTHYCYRVAVGHVCWCLFSYTSILSSSGTACIETLP